MPAAAATAGACVRGVRAVFIAYAVSAAPVPHADDTRMLDARDGSILALIFVLRACGGISPYLSFVT
jgi:hypothetical protein